MRSSRAAHSRRAILLPGREPALRRPRASTDCHLVSSTLNKVFGHCFAAAFRICDAEKPCPQRCSIRDPATPRSSPSRRLSCVAPACASALMSSSPSTVSASRSSPGENYGLLGPNGAGKTTTISMICGLLASDGGTVEVAGKPMTTASVAAKAELGYVPQELAIYPDMTARENLRFFARLYNLRGRARQGAHRHGPRPHRPHRAGGRPGERVLGRDAATAQHGARPAARASPADPRRADRRRGPAEP